VILKRLLPERVIASTRNTIFSSLKALLDTFLLENAITFKMHPSLTFSAINHVLIEVLLNLRRGRWRRSKSKLVSRGYHCCHSFVSFLDYVVWPETFTNLAILVLFALLIAIRTKLEVLRPFVLTILARFSRTALFTLNAFLTMKINLSNGSHSLCSPIRVPHINMFCNARWVRQYMWYGEFDSGV
jgi:hypothetical protein